MISFKGDSGNRFVINAIMNLHKNFEESARKALQRSGVQIVGIHGRANDGLIKKQMNQSKSGRIYLVGIGRKGRVLKRLRIHQASAPGESPAVITGNLRESVYFKVQGSNQLKIGADTPYARILELGGNTGKNHRSRIARRNYLIRPILQSRRDINNNFISAINAGIKK